MTEAQIEPIASNRNTVRELSLRRNFSWTMLGNVYYAACQWAILAILAKLGNTTLVGEFALAVAIAGPVITFANLKLRAVQASDAKSEYSFGEYLGLRIFTTPVALLVIASIVAVSYRSDVGVVILFIGLAKSFETISDIMFGLFQQHEQMKWIALSQILKGTLSLIVFAGVLTSTESLALSVAGMAASWALILLVFDIPVAASILAHHPKAIRVAFKSILRPLTPSRDFNRLRQLMWRTLPLGITVLLGSMSANIPRYFIAGELGTSQLGIFAGMTYVLVAGSLVINALGQSATPRLARYYAKSDHTAFKSLLLKLILLGAALGMVGIVVAAVAGKQILTLMYSSEYARHNDVFIWIMVDAAVGYAYVFLGTACSAMRRFTIQLPIHIVTLFALLVFSWMWIGDYGIKGAAWALLASGMIEATAYSVVVMRALTAGRQPAKSIQDSI